MKPASFIGRLLPVAVLVLLCGAAPAAAGECEDAWQQCFTRCTRIALKADAEGFEAYLQLENACDARCDKKMVKCLRATAGDKKSQVRGVLKKRQRAYAKICGRRWEKVLNKCRRAGEDLKRLKSCYKKRVRPELWDCYEQVNKDLPMPGAQD